jgi:integrase
LRTLAIRKLSGRFGRGFITIGVRPSIGRVRSKKSLLIELRGIDPRATRSTFKEYARAFEIEYEQRHAAGSVSQSQVWKVKAAIKALNPFFGDYQISQIGQSLFLDYVREAKKTNPTRKLENDTVTMNMIMRKAFKSRHVPELLSFRNPDPPREKRRILSEAEIKALLEVSDSKLKLFIIIAYTMGMRPNEILSLEWKEVDLERGFLKVLASKNKNRRGRTIAISPEALEALKVHRSKIPEATAVFPSRFKSQTHLTTIDGPWMEALETAGLDKSIVRYNLRHSAATEMARRIRAGVTTIVHVCRYLDHDIETFAKHYLHLTEDDTVVVAGLIEVPK